MKSIQRRTFLKQIVVGLSGIAALPFFSLFKKNAPPQSKQLKKARYYKKLAG